MLQIAEESGEVGRLLHTKHKVQVYPTWNHTKSIPHNHRECALYQGQNLHRSKEVFTNAKGAIKILQTFKEIQHH